MDRNHEREQGKACLSFVCKDGSGRMSTGLDCVILADGDFPTHDVPLELLEAAEHVVCCDGAAKSLLALRRVPDAIVGDGDSMPEDIKGLYADIIHVVDEQEDNDLTKATRYAVGRGWRRIAYVGATGKREDHTLGNISLLMRYRRDLRVEGIMLTDYGFFTPCRGTHTFSSFPRQQISIFNFTATDLSSEGLRWASYAYQEWWQGTLNEAISDSFTLVADGDYIVFQTYEGKN